MHRSDIFIFTFLFLFALFIRLYQIDTLPPGIFADEVTLGKHALSLLSQKTFVPYLSAYSHPTPLLYLTGWSIELFGRSVFALRILNIFIGAITVSLFYYFLKLFFQRRIALSGAILMLCSYPHIVISRLSYEPIPSLLFQLLTFFFLIKLSQEKQLRYVLGLGISLGCGLYTYLNFRPFLFIALFVTIIVLFKIFSDKQKVRKALLFLIGSLLLTISPLLLFSIHDPSALWGRTSQVFIFNQQLPVDEVTKELMGGAIRSLGIFGFLGDPSPKHNPSGVPFFDILTTLLIVVGLIGVSRTNRQLFLLVFVFVIPPFLSDILSLERIPNFHYYGIGHPHGLRISGIILVGLFLATRGINALYGWLRKKDLSMANIMLIGVPMMLCGLNLFWYFHQKALNPTFYYYNYVAHQAVLMPVIDIIKKTDVEIVYLSPTFLEQEHLSFFVPDRKLVPFPLSSSEQTLARVTSQPLTIMDVEKDNVAILNHVIKKISEEKYDIDVFPIVDPLNNSDAVIFKPKTFY